MSRWINIVYTPRTWAKKVLHATAKRFIVLVIHRRGGKTTAVLQHLNRDALTHRGHKYAYIAPLRNQAKRIAWAALKEIVRGVPNAQLNETELTVTYPNGSTLSLYGGDNADALRGIGLHGAALDEYAQMSPIIFSEIITKCVADTQGYVIILGTPKGKGHFFRVYSVAERSDMWESIFLTIDDSLKQESGKTIENLRKSLEDDRQLVKDGLMTQAEFEQEWYNSWEAAIKGAVYGEQLAWARANKRITTVPYDESLPVYTVWDLGISKGNSMAIGFFQKPSAKETWLIDYYENIGHGLSHYAGVIQKKPYVYGRHFFPHDIRNREKSSGKALFATAEKLFGRDKCDIVEKISVEDGIDLARGMWKRLWIDKKQGELFEDLIGSYVYEYDEARGVYRTKPVHNFASNAADMLRYAAVVEDLMDNEAIITRKRDDARAQKLAQTEPVEDEYMGTEKPRWLSDDDPDLPNDDELARM